MAERVIAVLVSCLVLAGVLSTCRHRQPVAAPAPMIKDVRVMTKTYRVNGKKYVPMSVKEALTYSAEGVATYYEAGGTRGALGERLRRGDYYAAHTTLPMPCRVRITSLSNGKSCEARVADRGPFTRGRLIDVSAAVARELGFTRKGVERVRVEVISVGDCPNCIKAEKKPEKK